MKLWHYEIFFLTGIKLSPYRITIYSYGCTVRQVFSSTLQGKTTTANSIVPVLWSLMLTSSLYSGRVLFELCSERQVASSNALLPQQRLLLLTRKFKNGTIHLAEMHLLSELCLIPHCLDHGRHCI